MALRIFPAEKITSTLNFQVFMECFSNRNQYQGAVNCCEACAKLLRYVDDLPSFSQFHVHTNADCNIMKWPKCKNCTSQKHQSDDCCVFKREETNKLLEVECDINTLLQDTKQAILTVTEMKQHVRRRIQQDIEKTKEAFSALRKAINDREIQIIESIAETSKRRERALELQLERLMLLWTQLKSSVDLVKKTRVENVTAIELKQRRKILEHRRDNLTMMQNKQVQLSLMTEIREVDYSKVQNLCQQVLNIRAFQIDFSQCKINISSLVVNKETLIKLTLKDVNSDIVIGIGNEIKVSATTEDQQHLELKPVEDTGNGEYVTSFIPHESRYYLISVIVNHQQIPTSPFKMFASLTDYESITENSCDKIVTQYGDKSFGHLNDIAVSPSGEVILVDSIEKHVIALNPTLSMHRIIWQTNKEGRTSSPDSVAVSEDNIIAISFWGSNEVQKYSLQGKFLSSIGKSGIHEGHFDTPRGVAFSKDKMLFVVDEGNYRIQVFHRTNKFAYTFGSRGCNPGQFSKPIKIAVSSYGIVAVTDNWRDCVCLFTQSGSFIKSLDCKFPWAIAFSPDGYIIAGCVRDRDKIRIWDPTYQIINQFGKTGTNQGQFCGVYGITVNSSGIVYIMDSGNSRVQIITNNNY